MTVSELIVALRRLEAEGHGGMKVGFEATEGPCDDRYDTEIVSATLLGPRLNMFGESDDFQYVCLVGEFMPIPTADPPAAPTWDDCDADAN